MLGATPRLCTLLGAPLLLSTGCLVSFVWMVGYRYQTRAEPPLVEQRARRGFDLVARDGPLELSFAMQSGRFVVLARNEGPDEITLALDRARLVRPDGTSPPLRVARKERRPVYVSWNAGTLQTVAPGKTLRVHVWPADAIRRDNAGDSPFGGSTVHETSRRRALADRAGDVGKSFAIELPVTRGGETHTYRVHFKVAALKGYRSLWA